MTNWYHIYSEQKSLLLTELENEIHSGVSRAKEETTFLSKFKEKYNSEYIEIQKQLSELNLVRFFIELKENLDLDKELSEEMGFNTLFKNSNSTNKINLKLLAKYVAIDEILYKADIENNENPESSSPNFPENKKWYTKTPIWIRKNQTEFMQLLEALILLERIQPRPNQNKRELIAEIADFFGIELSQNAESNLGKGRKTKLVPKLFDELYKMWIGKHKNLERK
jgi:hypothetical protein